MEQLETNIVRAKTLFKLIIIMLADFSRGKIENHYYFDMLC